MKNKLLTLLTLTILTGSLLVGCGGNETEIDNGAGTNTEANVNEETDTKGDDVDAQIDLSKYEETDYYYMVKDEADIDRAYVDGTEMDLTDMENFNYIAITIKDSLNMYNNEKGIVGYTKPNIECLYFAANDEWSMIAFSTEPVTSEGYPNGAAIVKTDELKAAMEVITDGTNYVTEDVEGLSEEKIFAEIITAIEDAGLIYDESAFEGIDLSDFKNNIPDGYNYMSCSTPLYIDDAISDLTEFMKVHAGKKFIVEFEEIVDSVEVNYTIYYQN